MTKGQLHFLIYGSLTLLAAGLVVTHMLPEEEKAVDGPDRPMPLGTPEVVSGLEGAVRPIPVPSPESLQTGKVLLGEKLFHDPRLSADGTVSCASCHNLEYGGDDGRKLSVGVKGAMGDVNAPTVFNSVFNFRQFWDGRASDLHEQVPGPLMNPIEMANDPKTGWVDIIGRISKDADYQEAFRREYGGDVSKKTITDALVQYESTLITPNAPFDRFLRGEAAAISEDAREGYRRFVDYGCISCHQGVNLGGNFFQQFGVMGNYFTDRGNLTKADLGRFNITGREEDRYVFKVPGLRNVAVTAPYFHDGSVETLDEAIKIMGRYQLGRDLSEEDRRYLAAFLESLTGEYRGARLKP